MFLDNPDMTQVVNRALSIMNFCVCLTLICITRVVYGA